MTTAPPTIAASNCSQCGVGCSTGDTMGFTGNTIPVTCDTIPVQIPYLQVQVKTTGYIWCFKTTTAPPVKWHKLWMAITT